MTDLHPADAARVERYARTIANGGQCEHGHELRECLVCIQLEHAERGSVAVRAAYAAGDFPPIDLLDVGCADCGATYVIGEDHSCAGTAAPAPRRIRGLAMGGLRARIAAGPPAPYR